MAIGVALGAGIISGNIEGDSTIIDIDLRGASLEIYIPEGKIIPNGIAVSIGPGIGSSMASSETKKAFTIRDISEGMADLLNSALGGLYSALNVTP